VRAFGQRLAFAVRCLCWRLDLVLLGCSELPNMLKPLLRLVGPQYGHVCVLEQQMLVLLLWPVNLAPTLKFHVIKIPKEKGKNRQQGHCAMSSSAPVHRVDFLHSRSDVGVGAFVSYSKSVQLRTATHVCPAVELLMRDAFHI
jgi:hypothetical protein